MHTKCFIGEYESGASMAVMGPWIEDLNTNKIVSLINEQFPNYRGDMNELIINALKCYKLELNKSI